MAKYAACICEGDAERAVINLLLDNRMLIFEREELIDEEVLQCRRGRDFEDKYLRKGFSEKITVYRILDSRSEEFKLRKSYMEKIDVINVITAPEIEMLIICNEGKFDEFQRLKRNKAGKPSTYCKNVLGYKRVKEYTFVYDYFSDIDVLKHALHEYKRLSNVRRGEKTIWDLLKDSAKLSEIGMYGKRK